MTIVLPCASAMKKIRFAQRLTGANTYLKPFVTFFVFPRPLLFIFTALEFGF
jgi:hypothetical protein